MPNRFDFVREELLQPDISPAASGFVPQRGDNAMQSFTSKCLRGCWAMRRPGFPFVFSGDYEIESQER